MQSRTQRVQVALFNQLRQGASASGVKGSGNNRYTHAHGKAFLPDDDLLSRRSYRNYRYGNLQLIFDE